MPMSEMFPSPPPTLCLLPNEAGGLCQISIFSTSSAEWSGPCQPCPRLTRTQVTHICPIEMSWDHDDGKHYLHFPWQLLQCIAMLQSFGWVLENIRRMVEASVQPRAWFCLRGRNWYFIEFSRLGTWLFAHKTKCWCQSKNRMSLSIW